MTVKELARAATLDAPAATVAVNDPAPDMFAALDDADLKALQKLLAKGLELAPSFPTPPLPRCARRSPTPRRHGATPTRTA